MEGNYGKIDQNGFLIPITKLNQDKHRHYKNKQSLLSAFDIRNC